MRQYQRKKTVENNVNFVIKAGGNKKVVIAVCLVAVMVFMWIKVLMKNKPEASIAAGKATAGMKSVKEQNNKVAFIKLPEIKGRNDSLTRDFFDSKGWVNFVGQEQEIAKNANPDEDAEQRMINRLARKLRLQTIIVGDKPEAFINDKALSQGNKFTLKEGTENYVFEVTNISEDKVVLKCKQSEVTLKFKQY